MLDDKSMDKLVEKSKREAKEAEELDLKAQDQAVPPPQDLPPTLGMLNKASEIEAKLRAEVLTKIKGDLEAYKTARMSLIT